MSFWINLFIAALCALNASASFAADNATRFEKLNAVLSYLGVPEERSYQDDLKALNGVQTREQFETLLKVVDPTGALKRYAVWNDNFLTLFLDRDTRENADLILTFKNSSAVPSDPSDLVYTLWLAALKNPKKLPLWGIRIALDPGHMGSAFWDKETGKYVHTKDGRHVSEGETALHITLLLAQQLRDLGAEVLVTRHDLEAVSNLPYETYDLTPYALNEIRASADLPWFDALLASEKLGPALFAAARRHPEIKKLQSERRRGEYFIKRADLLARAEMINAFNPHFTVVVHMDAPDQEGPPHYTRDGWLVSKLQRKLNRIRSYVSGNYFAEEMATREQRASALGLLFDSHRWGESVMLSTALVNAVSASAGIAIKRDATDQGAIRVSDGVYARNLALNRLVNKGAMAYLELCYYDYAKEFNRLSVKEKTGEVDGLAFKYSSRLDEIVEGLKEGIVNYVAGTGAGISLTKSKRAAQP